MINSRCKICRRQGVKLFLKGEKCSSPKCTLVKRPYPPGEKRKKRRYSRGLSEYGKELSEKQKIKKWYNLSERQFRIYVKETLKGSRKVENAADLLIKKIESRFDNVVFRLGFAPSRPQARQLISHGHFLLNDKLVNIPSCRLKKGDKVGVKPSFIKKAIFKELQISLKKHKPPSWLEFDIKKTEGKVIGDPTLKEANPVAEISVIFEFYSR